MDAITSLAYSTLSRDAKAIAQYSEGFGLIWGQMVTLWENTDEMWSMFWDYDVEYTVLCNRDGQLPLVAYSGGDLDEALKVYGETVAYASNRRKELRSR
jgi:hypothetical protein